MNGLRRTGVRREWLPFLAQGSNNGELANKRAQNPFFWILMVRVVN
jgi:hypothetical protein